MLLAVTYCILCSLLSQSDSFPLSTETAQEVPRSPYDGLIKGGDMLIGDAIEDEVHEAGSRKRRAAYKHPFLRWPSSTIPYKFDTISNVSEHLRNLTMEAFYHIMEHTCVKFAPKTANDKSFINITGADQTRCFSYVGRRDGGVPLNLGSACNELGVVIHEILHALGFLHEHTRPDRDDYVIVNHTNIRNITGADKQFEKLNVTENGGIELYNISYDKQSIMHYDSFTFTKFAKNGIIPAAKQEYMTMYSKENPLEKLGNKRLSIKDILRVNMHFSCKINLTMILATAKTTTTTTTTTTTATTTPIATTATNPGKPTDPTATTIKTATQPTQTDNGGPVSIDTTTTPEDPTTTNPQSTIIIDGTIFNVTQFGTPDSASTNYMSFYNVLIISCISIYYCFFLGL